MGKCKTKKMASGGLATSMFGKGRVQAVSSLPKGSKPSKPSKMPKFGGKK